MALSLEEIKHIAELSRLDLTETETAQYREQLGSILDYVSALEEVKTEGIEPTAQVSGLFNVFRNDEVREWNESEREAALNQAEREKGNIKVKRVL